MGLCTLPTPAEGLMCVIMYNMEAAISFVTYILQAFLHVIGVRWEEVMTLGEHETAEAYSITRTNLYVEFRHRAPTLKFEELSVTEEDESVQDCSVCLTQFEPESEINHLPCRHVFHKVCLEKWINHWNITCPLCRTPMIAPNEDPYNMPW